MTTSYSAEQIQVLEGLEPVRKRPGMYIGTTGPRGLHHLVYEVVDNSIDEALAGHCTHIEVDINASGSVTVTDDGRGIPTDIHPRTGKSALETVMTVLHAGGKFGGGGYKVSGGLHGVGVSVVNALSEWLEATVWRSGNIHTQRFERGISIGELASQPDTETRTGTSISFMPDTQIFTTGIEFDYDTLARRLRELAYLNAGVKITFTDGRREEPRIESYQYHGGIKEYIAYMNREKQSLHEEIIYMQGEKNNVQIEVALQWCVDAYTDNLLGFANNIRTIDGGTHLEGLKTVLTRTMNSIARKRNKLKENESNLGGENIREGLTGVISVKVSDPEFEGQTKTKLGNTEVRGIVDSLVGEGLTEYLEFHPPVADSILEKAIQAFNAAEAARRARELVRRKSVLESSTLPGKLADCSERNPAGTEIFLVEGDSAGGCFHGDTLVSLADGRSISFKEIVAEQAQGKEHFCYTVSRSGKIAIERIINPRMTKANAEVIKLTLDNGETMICTPDHPFMLRDCSYKPAALLTPADSLMPLYRQLSRKNKNGTVPEKSGIDGYEMVWNPHQNQWIYTDMLVADFYNLRNNVYLSSDGNHRHHVDYIKRLPAEEHLALHRGNLEFTLHRPDVIEKSRQVHMSEEFRAMMSERMQQPETRKILTVPEKSEQAKAQWEDEAYKAYMQGKWREFYEGNETYRYSLHDQSYQAQSEYWSDEANRITQAERVRNYYANNPEARSEISSTAQDWRSQKTREQWTSEFRAQRRAALHETYYRKTAMLKKLYRQEGYMDLELYDRYRRQTRDKCSPFRTSFSARTPGCALLKLQTFCDRLVPWREPGNEAGDDVLARQAIRNYNHRIVSVERLEERMDVYDIEVPHTHNFALASGVFVHNSAKQGRDRRFQAILPLRGKILNIEKTDDAKIYKNNEIQSMITALGLGIKGEEFDPANLRYHQIVIMTDADVDGAHIRTLLLTFFYRYQRNLVDQGYIYIACPPLYKVERGRNHFYCYSDRELQERLGELPKNANYNIQRFKGLGEMMPQQLWDTTMNPDTRTMKRVEIEDAAEADRIFTVLMGDRVAPRRQFIETYGPKLNLTDLDI